MIIGDKDTIALFVGVTGHRDMLDAEIPSIRTRVASELERIESVANGVRLILLSGLAEGGDQIVVEEALKRGWEVFAVFPMPFSDYLADFTTDQRRNALIKLKERCAEINEIPWATSQDPDISDPRDQQYRNQSIYIARQSQVVIALWDGSPAQAKGACGTAYVAALCHNGSFSPVAGEVLVAPETTPLIHIPVRRKVVPELNPVS